MHEKEKCRRPKEAYLYLIDLKVIMEKQWKHFDAHFAAVGHRGGRDKSLSWVGRLNELRNMLAHPAKMHLSSDHFSKEDKEFLIECDELIRRLLREISPID
jgi:hypothetical protein